MRLAVTITTLVTLLSILALVSCSCPTVQGHFAPHPLSKIQIENILIADTQGTITIEAPILNGTGNFVTISWSNVASPFPGNQDWIGVYSPKPTDYTTVTPAKYKYVVSDATGSGSSTFWLLNMRDSYTVAYFTGGMETPTLLAESTPVEFSNYHVPLQIHLALTADPTQMKVSWNSAQNMFPSLNWGTTATNLNNTIIRVLTTTYAVTDLCGAPATTKGWRAPGYLHTALITGLTPNTEYFYQVGDESSYSKSAVLSFYSAPVTSPETEVDFFIFGDLGQVELDGSNEASMMDGSILTTTAMQLDLADGSIATNLSAAVFHIGDISYARGYATLWEQFFYQISNMTGNLPWMVTDGNHETDFPNSGSEWNGTDSGGECGVPYEKRFSMPTTGTAGQTWYSLNYGPIHFTFISTEHPFYPGSPQFEWVQQDFAAVDRTTTPFLVLSGHRPMYIDSTNASPDGGDQSTALLLRQALEPLMVKYQVDIAFWGHHHSYQRTCAVLNEQCTSDGIIHIVTGAAGGGFSTNLQPTPPAYTEYVEDNIHGYIRAHVRNSQLTLDFVDSINRTILDTITISPKVTTNIQLPPTSIHDGDDDMLDESSIFEKAAPVAQLLADE